MPLFVPYPPDSLRRQGESSRPSSTGNHSPSRLHYTKVWAAALKMGYTRRELAVMPFGEIVFDLAAMGEEQEVEQEQGVTMATQEDIRSMLG